MMLGSKAHDDSYINEDGGWIGGEGLLTRQ